MANLTLSSPFRGDCPAPFLDGAKFGNGGLVSGRFCAAVPSKGGRLYCCLPCPATDFLYPKRFTNWYTAAEALNVLGLVLLTFLMASFICLPAEKTRRHYLSYGLIIGAMFMALGFVVPLGAKPEQCFDEITPNDMYTSVTCAISGAFLISGGLALCMWILIRALSMHLQICWDVLPGKKFMYSAHVLGWGIIATLFTVTITVTGVSFRFGDVCHVNSQDSLKDFWGPLLAIGGAATIVQLCTFTYCLKVYVKNMWSDEATETQSSAGLPSYTTSVRTKSARAVYRRVRKVLWLQWRGLTIVVFILVDVIFFSVAFIYLNSVETRTTEDINKAMPFLLCLMGHPTDPSPCFKAGQKIFMSESTVTAVLIMLSLCGIQCFILLVRSAMFPAWLEFFRSQFSSKREFVSLDAKQYTDSKQPFRDSKQQYPNKNYELSNIAQSPVRAPESAVTSPSGSEFDSWRRSMTNTPDHFAHEVQRQYQTPTLSFSAPRSRSRGEFDHRSTYARGGLALHPIDDDEEHNMRKI